MTTKPAIINVHVSVMLITSAELGYVRSNELLQRLWRMTADFFHDVGLRTEDTVLMVLGYRRQMGCPGFNRFGWNKMANKWPI